MDEHTLETYYIRYLREIREVKESTVKHYQDALKYISKFLKEEGKLQSSVFEISDIESLNLLKEYLYNNENFMALDKRGHQMYSAGFNNYFRFASGVEFSKIRKPIETMDIAMPIGEQKEIESKSWKRSSILKDQVIEYAGYNCEIDMNHVTFTAKSTNHPYMEGHHILPMRYQEKFSSSLDVYANIICLCPICHRLLHYGVASEKQFALNKIYAERAQRLALSGIKISKSDFENLVT